VAFALQADGWWLRSDIIWAKPNPMPESVTDRPTKSHEYVFLLTKAARYYWDAEAVKEPSSEVGTVKSFGNKNADARRVKSLTGNMKPGVKYETKPTRNIRSVWSIATQPYHEAHFATMPEKLVEPCVLAGSKPGDLVLDPFAGSGTVGVVCRRFARRFVGVELNPAYVGMATLRLAQTQPGLALEATS
jgi:DNA modification methylase